MRKLFIFLVIITTLISVTGCQLSSNIFTEKNKLPKKAAQHLDDEATLQMIYEGTKGAYIVFRSEGEVEAETSIEDHEITINFNVTEEKNNEEKAHIYYLKEDLTYDTIRVFVNEDEIPFSKVTHM